MTAHPSRRTATAAMLGTLCALPGRAQPVVRRSGKLLVTLSAGTSLDLIARRLVEIWAEHFQLSYEIENLPGAGGAFAARRLMTAPLDGTTLLLSHSGLINVVPHVMKDTLGFDPEHHLLPVALLARTPLIVCASSALNMPDFTGLLAHLRRTGVPIHYAVGPLYGTGHLSGAALFHRLGVQAKAVSYTQTSQALLDVATQRVPVGIFPWLTSRPLLDQGSLHGLCVLSNERLSAAPAIPTISQLGMGHWTLEPWAGLFARTETPGDNLKAQTRAIHAMFNDSRLSLPLAESGYQAFYKDTAHARTFIQQDSRQHQELLQRLPAL